MKISEKMKFLVETEGHSKAIQMALFKLGYRWPDNKDAPYLPKHADEDALFANRYTMNIGYSEEDYYYRADSAWVATTLDDITEEVPEGKEQEKRLVEGSKVSNPKDAVGDTKVPLWLLSGVAKAEWALAQFAGMCKYAAWNWRIAGVRSSVYLSAMQRHMDAYTAGEEFDPVDGTHHLGNIMACCAILLDAKAAGKITDDRPPSVGIRDTYIRVQEQMVVLKDKYKGIDLKHFTIEDTQE